MRKHDNCSPHPYTNYNPYTNVAYNTTVSHADSQYQGSYNQWENTNSIYFTYSTLGVGLYKFCSSSCEGNWRESEDISVISGETLLLFPMEARLEDNPAPRERTILVSTLLERDIESSLPVVSGKKCLQKYVHQLFDEMPVKGKNGINSSSSKENSARMMEQVIDPECIASVAINFSVLQILNSCWTRRD